MIKFCRVCGNDALTEIIDLGVQYLTGVFPNSVDSNRLTKGPLKLLYCAGEKNCGLVQLSDSYDPAEMYGANYGYRSGLNASMVKHLANRIHKVTEQVILKDGDVVIDIGSNDGTTLGFYKSNFVRIGIDPTAKKFAEFYPQGSLTVASFFSTRTALSASKGKKATVITAFSMMYDLENPVGFINEVAQVLDPNGVFIFEQSYLPLMLERGAFDTICHEHIEYYGLRQIDWILRAAKLEVIDVELNEVNGGSFAITAAHNGHRPVSPAVQILRDKETAFWKNAGSLFVQFRDQANASIQELKSFVISEIQKGKTFGALGASTKGNVLLQAAAFSPTELSVVGDVNPDKFGCFTPGTWIPIVSELEALRDEYDYYIVLPWHFKEFFLSSSNFKNRTLVFPLPQLEVISL